MSTADNLLKGNFNIGGDSNLIFATNFISIDVSFISSEKKRINISYPKNYIFIEES